MSFSTEEKASILRLVGQYTEEQFAAIYNALEFYTNTDMALFVPRLGFTKYKVPENHTHPSYSFIYNVDCYGKFFVKGKDVKTFVPTSEISALAPNTVHHERAEESYCSFISIYIEKNFFESRLKKYSKGKDFHFEFTYFKTDETLMNLLKLFMIEYVNNAPGKTEVLNALQTHITNILIRKLLDISVDTLAVESRYEIDKLISYLYKNIDQKITIHKMARFLNLSTSHFSKIFKEVTNYSPIEYLNKIRLEEAKKMLLLSSKSLTEIALDCGFSGSSYFSQLFMEKYEITPSRYRKNFKNTSA